MPIYEFECQTCGERFEELMRLSDPDPTGCNCGKHQPVRRALTAPAFRLAGSGWYETDFKKDGDHKRNLAGGGGNDGGGDAKPAEAAKTGAPKTEPAKSEAPKAEPAKTAAASGGTADT